MKTYSVKEIAARYAMSEAAVSMNLMRLRKRLRMFLTERGFEVRKKRICVH